MHRRNLVEGENADPDYFGRDTGDASKDDPLNEDGIGENELLSGKFWYILQRQPCSRISVVSRKHFRKQIRTGL